MSAQFKLRGLTGFQSQRARIVLDFSEESAMKKRPQDFGFFPRQQTSKWIKRSKVVADRDNRPFPVVQKNFKKVKKNLARVQNLPLLPTQT